MCQKTKMPHITRLDGDRNEKYSYQPNTYIWEYLQDDLKVKKHSERDLKDMDTEDLRVVVIKIKGKKLDLQGGP